MAVFGRALQNRDCDLPHCVYRLKPSGERQEVFAGIACAVEIDTETPKSKKYLLTCNKVIMENGERRFSAHQWQKPCSLLRQSRNPDINGENYFLKHDFCFLTPPDTWKLKKRLKAKAFKAGECPDKIKSLILDNSRDDLEIEWEKNSETGRYQHKKEDHLEDHTSLGSPVLWKDLKTQRLYVIGVVDKEEDFFPRLFGEDDLRNLGKFVILFISFDYLQYEPPYNYKSPIGL